MSDRLFNLRTRLAKVEGQVADKAIREKMANCNCFPRGEKLPSTFRDTEEFEAAANLPCPVHGVRRLGKLMRIEVVNMDLTPTEESAKLIQAMNEYELRISQLPPPSPELEDESEEF